MDFLPSYGQVDHPRHLYSGRGDEDYLPSVNLSSYPPPPVRPTYNDGPYLTSPYRGSYDQQPPSPRGYNSTQSPYMEYQNYTPPRQQPPNSYVVNNEKNNPHMNPHLPTFIEGKFHNNKPNYNTNTSGKINNYLSDGVGFVGPMMGVVANKPSYKIYCKAGGERFAVAIRDGKVILTRPNSSDPTQNWFKDEKYSTEVKDEERQPSFILLNKGTGQAIKHSVVGYPSQYAKDIISRAKMTNCNPTTTPVEAGSKLSADSGPLIDDPTLYRSLAGALQYLTITRPDISYAVQQVCLFMHAPREPHLHFLKRILRYIQGTLDHGLTITPSRSHSLTAYSDADWGGCPDSRRSTSGYCVFLGDNLVSWSSKRQLTVSRSSAEAEYWAVANAVAETSWLRNLLIELQVPLTRATLVFCDNISAVYLSTNPVQHQRTKHIELDIHFVREKVQVGTVRVLHVPSEYQYADIFTKGLPRHLFMRFRSSLSIRPPPAPTAGVY